MCVGVCVCVSQFGFPFCFKGEESRLLNLDQFCKYRYYRDATDFCDAINNCISKESKNDSILGPFKKQSF